jgi:hypothetical protein
MNCLLMREISVENTIRMWDTYLVGVFPPIDFSLFENVFIRLRDQTPSLNSIYTFVPHFL